MTMGVRGMWRLRACRPPCQTWPNIPIFSSIFSFVLCLWSPSDACLLVTSIYRMISDCQTAAFLPLSSCIFVCGCDWLRLVFCFFSWHKCTCMATPCYLDRRRQNACVTALNGSHRSHSERNKHLALPRKHWWTSLRIPHSIFHNGGEVLMMSKRLWSATAIFVDVTRVLSPTSQKYDRVTRDW